MALGISLAALGCASNPGAQAEAGVQKVQRERTPDKLLKRGLAFAQVGDLTRAEQYLTAALDEGGDPNKVLPPLLRVCVESGRYRTAIRHAQNYLEVHPADMHLRYLLGTLYAAVGDSFAARQQLERVLEAEPTNADAHYALAVLARDQDHNLVRADYHFRQYLRLSPKGPHAEEAQGSLLKSVP